MPRILECGLFLFPVSDGSELEGDGSLWGEENASAPRGDDDVKRWLSDRSFIDSSIKNRIKNSASAVFVRKLIMIKVDS